MGWLIPSEPKTSTIVPDLEDDEEEDEE